LRKRRLFQVNKQGMSEMVKRVVCKDAWVSSAIFPYVENIVQSVEREFDSKAGLFNPILVRMDRRKGDEFDATKRAGVYVYICEPDTCLKVGKSHLNASKRALEHCRDNTKSKDGTILMTDHLDSDKTYLLIFALQNESMHWVLALEHYLENTLKPRIPSKRNG